MAKPMANAWKPKPKNKKTRQGNSINTKHGRKGSNSKTGYKKKYRGQGK